VLSPISSAALTCDRRPSSTRRTTSRRSISLRLIVTSSFAICPASAQQHVAESGHLHLGATHKCPITSNLSTTPAAHLRYPIYPTEVAAALFADSAAQGG
jgi:hypothetical protein